MFAQSHVQAEVTAERSERGVVVKIDGELFTEYLTKAGQSPAMWPIIGPTGKPMTRSYPVGPAKEGVKETDDHPHHQSLWFTHDKVNGADFWEANSNDGKGEQGPHIAHREFVEVEERGRDGANRHAQRLDERRQADLRGRADDRFRHAAEQATAGSISRSRSRRPMAT